MIQRVLLRPGLAVALLLVIAVGSVSLPVQAEGKLAFVYGTNHYDGSIYRSTMIPPSEETVYLLADTTSVLAARMTEIYYWPITNEYKPDWDAANQIVEGSLELYRAGKLLEVIPLTEYVLQYDGMDRFNTSVLYLEDEARTAYADFEQQKQSYRESLAAYHDAITAYRGELELALEQLQRGDITEEEIPVPPQPLQDMTLFSSEILFGFPLQLPSGSYRIQMRAPGGEVVPDSEKNLIVFTALREGVGYEIRSDARWTVPERSQDPSEKLYTLPRHVFYVTPARQSQYNQLAYTRMNEPQDESARSDRTIWVSHRPVTQATLQVDAAAEGFTLEMQQFSVRQLMGSRLGYEIVIHDPQSDQQPAFQGFCIHPAAQDLDLVLLDEMGAEVPGSQRTVHVLHTERGPWIYGLSALPLLVALGFVLFRRQRVSHKVLGHGLHERGGIELRES